jgi:hypothetical protein
MVDEISQGLAGELVDDVEDLDRAPGGGDVELVVQRPHMIRPPGTQLRVCAERDPPAFTPVG